MMNISVFGIGYVGIVTAACFAEEGCNVICVDVVEEKVNNLNAGISPVIEDKIDELVERNVKAGRLSATTDGEHAILNTDMSMICVGTPSDRHGALDNRYVEQVAKEIGEALRTKKSNQTIVLRSTVLPGTFNELLIPVLEKWSHKKAGEDFDVLFHPEFLREGTSVYDFYNPPKIVIGETNKGSSSVLMEMYGKKFKAPRIVCDAKEAEMVKYCDNLFHALKITFANEIGQYCYKKGIDSHHVMDIFCKDRKLNISTKYLKPGFAFGGSCLPKDLKAFLDSTRKNNVSTPMLSGVLESNKLQIERVLQMILDTGAKTIGFYGMAFKKGTDDMRESPFIELAERLLGKGKDILLYDEKVQLSRLIGKNKAVIVEKFPHLATHMVKSPETLVGCDLIVICHKPTKSIIGSWKKHQKELFDLTGFELADTDIDYYKIV